MVSFFRSQISVISPLIVFSFLPLIRTLFNTPSSSISILSFPFSFILQIKQTRISEKKEEKNALHLKEKFTLMEVFNWLNGFIRGGFTYFLVVVVFPFTMRVEVETDLKLDPPMLSIPPIPPKEEEKELNSTSEKQKRKEKENRNFCRYPAFVKK